ncbi:MAG: LicD family protein [Lachnospiraceae bacterium]|jgi:lipopolysaccharide cholinephosphotransferase|nr:LicD family protein [Lachnospiraceae bacterium]
MGREYDEATLKRLQQLELGILKDFIWLCEKYELTWFSFAGTAIGALRHKGFIPWDDDIDVCLPRPDFEKFLMAAKKEFPDKYRMMNAEIDENYPLTTTRWMLAGTKFKEMPLRDVPCELGIFLDIYPFDNVADDEKAYKKQAWDAWFWSKVLILRCLPRPMLRFRGWKAALVTAVCVAVNFFLGLFGFSRQKIYARCKAAMTRYNDRETKRISYLCDTDRFWNTIALEDLYPIQKLDFEDIQVNFPHGVEKMLSQMYPDYMTLPPVEKRRNHFPYELDFGRYGEQMETAGVGQ